jgi:hypothetical protein
MKKDLATEFKLSELILMKLEGTIQPDQLTKLKQWLREDPEAVEYYVEYMMQYSGLTQPGDISISDLPQETVSPVLETSLWMALSEFEQEAEAVEIERPRQRPDKLDHSPVGAQQARTSTVGKFSLYALLLSSAALIFLIVYALGPAGRGSEVATLSDTLNARWSDTDQGIRNGVRLSTKSEPLWLREGIARVLFDNGSSVVIEGPAEFEILTDDQIQLNYGRLFATVPKQAIGFTVSTTHSKIIDLGTEFGVKADPDGTELHVIRGKTMLISGAARNSKTQYEISEGQARAVTAAGAVQDISLKNQAFIRRIDSQTQFVWKGQGISLADIVGGGNGLGTGRLNAGINYLGETVILDTYTSQAGPKEYVRVRSNGFVDGVFVPNGPSQVISNGTVFDFEETNGRYWLGILNGAWHQIALTVKVPRHQLRLNGMEYGVPDRPAIYLSSNQGITFNLQAIRLYTKMEITRFTALCGLSETYRQYWDIMKQYPHFQEVPNATFYVLVDGKPRFVRKDMTPLEEACKIEVDIAPEDQFLTLATTQGSDKSNNGDWTLFAEPYLALQE